MAMAITNRPEKRVPGSQRGGGGLWLLKVAQQPLKGGGG